MEKLSWQCRRGMLELDELLQCFLQTQYDHLDASGRQAFQRLLRCADQDLQAYLLGSETPKDGELANVSQQIRQSYIP